MSILLGNKLLEAAEQKIETDLTPQNRANYMRVVVGGMKVAMHGGPKSILSTLKDSKDPISDCAVGAVNLVLLMRKESRGTMPYKAMIPAAMTLMLKALDFADRLGLVKITNDELVKATHIFTNTLMARFKITAPMIHNAVRKVHGIMQSPRNMELLKRKAGMVVAPNASSPTPMPNEANEGE